MEDKYNKTLENVLILADDEVIEICTKKSYYEECPKRNTKNSLSRRNLRNQLAKHRKRQHFGLKIKAKRLHKKIRHYSMKIVNFNAILLHDNSRNDYYVVFYRSGLSFSANIAQIYFTGVANPPRKQKKRRHRAVKRKQSASFENYLRQSIKQHYHKYLDGKHSLISVHAIFTVDNPNKSKVFITRDITTHSDIAKFIKMIQIFDPTLKSNANKKLEDYLTKRMKISMNNVLAIAQVNQSQKNLFIQWNEKLARSFHRKHLKTSVTQLINTNSLNLRLDHIRLNGADCTSVKRFMNIVEELVTNKIQDEKIERKLENQLNSCKTFIACLDAFGTRKSDITKIPRSLKSEIKKDIGDTGDTGDSKVETSGICDEKVQGIMNKIDVLQKRIRKCVEAEPSLRKDVDIGRKKSQESLKSLEEIGKSVGRRDTLPKSKFCKPEVLRSEGKDAHVNLMKIEEYLKQDFEENRLRIQDIIQDESPKVSPKQQDIKEAEVAPKVDEPEVSKKISDIEKLLTSNLKHPGSKFEKLLMDLQKKTSSEDFQNIIQQLKIQWQKRKSEMGLIKTASKTKKAASKEEEPKSDSSQESCSTGSNSLKSIFAAKNVKLQPRSKQKRQSKTENKAAAAAVPSQPDVNKLENFIDQILSITKTYFANGSPEEPKALKSVPEQKNPKPSKTNTSTIITIKKYTEMDDTKSEMSTNTVNSYLRSAKVVESAVQTDRKTKRRLVGKLTQTDMDSKSSDEKKAIAMETQTDISIHKHAQIKFSGMSMQLSKNVTITNVRKNVINVRNICEETSEAVKRLLEKEAVYNEDNPITRQEINGDLRKGSNKAEILGQIKNTLENVIDRFKKSTLLISKASNLADITENLKKIMVPAELPGDLLKQSRTDKSTFTLDKASTQKEERSSNLAMSLKLLKNLSEVTKTIRKNPREAARKLHGIRNELMQYRKNKIYDSKVSSQLYLSKTSSTLTAKQSKVRVRRSNTIFPKDVPLNIYGYPASSTDLKPDLHELNRIFTPKTRSICNTELSILKHRDRYADHIASHLSSKQSVTSKYCFDFKTMRTKSAQMKSRKCQMYIAKTYKKSYANSLSQTACTTPNVPQIQTAIENPLVPKIVRPVRWKHPLPESPQLSDLSLNDVKPFNSEYPRKDHVSLSSHSYLERLLDSSENHEPLIKCSDSECAKCSEHSSPLEVSVCGKSPKETTDFIVNKGKAHFKTENCKNTEPQVDRPPEASSASTNFDFGRFMRDPLNDGANLIPRVSYTVCPVNIIQNKKPDSPKSSTPLNKRLFEVKNSQNKMQKSIQQAIIQNQEKFQAMQRILALSKPQERKMAHPSSSKNASGPPKIKTSHTKKIPKIGDATTSKSKNFPTAPLQSNSVQTAVGAFKTVRQVQPHPKLKQLQQHQIPLKPKINNNPPVASKPSVEPNTSASFNKKYSEVSLSSLQTIVSKEEKASTKTIGSNVKNVKRSQEDIQKYIALVEQKFLKTFSLNEQEKEGAYKNLVDEIQGMLNVLNSKDKVDKKMKIKKSLEKLAKESEIVNEAIQQKKLSPTTSTKKNIKNEVPANAAEVVKYTKALESVGKSLKDFQNNFEENIKISEAATEKLLNWKTTTTATKSTHEVISKASESSKTSMQYTLSEKERIIEEKLTAPSKETPVVVIKDPPSTAKMDPKPIKQEVETSAAVKKKTSDISRPTTLSNTINSSDSLIESEDIVNCSSISMSSAAKPKSKTSRSSRCYSKKISKIQESPNSTDTSLVPISNDNTENSYLTITEYSESESSNSEIKITPLVEFSIEINLCDYLHYSYKTQPTVASVIPHIYHNIIYTETIEPKPITQAYKQKYSTNNSEKSSSYDYPISSTLNFSSILSEDSVHIEQEFIKNYSDKLFSESINTILSKNSEFTLRNILGDKSTERLVPKASSHYYDYVDLLSNISRIFIEPEIAQFYQPKYVSCVSKPERTTKTYYIVVIFCRVELNYVEHNPSHCNLLESSKSSLSPRISPTLTRITPTKNRSLILNERPNSTSSPQITQNSLSHLSVTQNTVSDISHLTLTQVSSTSLNTGEIFGEIPEQKAHSQKDLEAHSQKDFLEVHTEKDLLEVQTEKDLLEVQTEKDLLEVNSRKDLLEDLPPNLSKNNLTASITSAPYYSIKSSITKFEYLNENVEIQTVTRASAENVDQTDNVNILIQNVDEQVNLVKKPSLEELYIENICFATKTSSTYFNVNNSNNETNFIDDELTLVKAKDEIVDTVNVRGDFKRLGNKLAQQSNELGQILINNQYQQRRLPKLVSVKNFNTHPFMSNPFLNHRYDCNYDLKLTISPKYLATNFPSPTCMQILPLLKNRIGSMSHSLTMKIELNHSKGSRSSSRNVSFKKPKRSIVVYNKNSQKNETLSKKLSSAHISKEEVFHNSSESYKMVLIFFYVSLFSFIFVCMTLNYKCE